MLCVVLCVVLCGGNSGVWYVGDWIGWLMKGGKNWEKVTLYQLLRQRNCVPLVQMLSLQRRHLSTLDTAQHAFDPRLVYQTRFLEL